MNWSKEHICLIFPSVFFLIILYTEPPITGWFISSPKHYDTIITTQTSRCIKLTANRLLVLFPGDSCHPVIYIWKWVYREILCNSPAFGWCIVSDDHDTSIFWSRNLKFVRSVVLCSRCHLIFQQNWLKFVIVLRKKENKKNWRSPGTSDLRELCR